MSTEPEIRAATLERLTRNGKTLAMALIYLSLPYHAAMYFLNGRLALPGAVELARTGNLIWGSLSLLLVLATRINGVREKLPVILTAFAFELSFAWYVAYSTATTMTLLVDPTAPGGLRIPEGGAYDFLVWSCSYLVVSVCLQFVTPVSGILRFVGAGIYSVFALYAYHLHPDPAAWMLYTLLGYSCATFLSQMQTRRIEREVKLELENRELLIRAATSKLERELELAREIQSSSLPPAHSSFRDVFEVSCHLLAHDRVGGDWFALRHVDSETMIVMVLDVTGKGMQAALIVHAVQSLWMESLDIPGFDPQRWMSIVNKALVRLGERTRHTLTMGIAVLTTDQLTYWSAGHCPAVLVWRDGEGEMKAKQVFGHGSVMGLDAEMELRPTVASLPLGGDLRIMIGSDGVFDTLMHKRRGLLQLAADLDAFGEQAIRDLPDHDDKTLVVISRKQVA